MVSLSSLMELGLEGRGVLGTVDFWLQNATNLSATQSLVVHGKQG